MKNLLLSHCHGATVHEGEALAGCKHNWICDECGCMCHAINGSAAPELLEALQAWDRFAEECQIRDVKIPLWAALLNEEAVRLTTAAIVSATGE